MSDILEDQKIHLIVKDYRRMVEQHDKLVEIGKEFQNQLIAKEKELAKVKMELDNVKGELKNIKAKGLGDGKARKAIRSQLVEVESRSISAHNNAERLMNTMNGIIENVKEINRILNEQ